MTPKLDLPSKVSGGGEQGGQQQGGVLVEVGPQGQKGGPR